MRHTPEASHATSVLVSAAPPVSLLPRASLPGYARPETLVALSHLGTVAITSQRRSTFQPWIKWRNTSATCAPCTWLPRCHTKSCTCIKRLLECSAMFSESLSAMVAIRLNPQPCLPRFTSPCLSPRGRHHRSESVHIHLPMRRAAFNVCGGLRLTLNLSKS